MDGWDWVGWVATGLFSLSYVLRKQMHLLICQAVAASVWLTYGLLLGLRPVIVANVIVAVSAALSAFRLQRRTAVAEAPQ